MAAVLRSSVGMALRRAAAAPASASSSRLSSAGGANTRAARTYHHGHEWRSSYDAEAYSLEVSPATKADKFDGYFSFAAFLGTAAFVWLMEEGYHYWFRHDFTRPAPRMTPRRGRW